MRYRFDDFELDDRRFRLTRGGRALRIEPKVFDVLRYLLAHPDRVVTRDELLDEVWGGDAVTPAVVATAIASARRVLGQRRGGFEPIRTVHGRGYQLDVPVHALEGSEPPSSFSTAPIPSSDTPPPRSSESGSFPPVRAYGGSATDSGGFLPVATPVTRPAADPLADAAGDTPPGPLVGRDAHMQRLQVALHELRRGRGRLILLVGEAGSGKTRLARELAHEALRSGTPVLIGRCSPIDSRPLSPWVPVVRAALGELSRAQAQRQLGSTRSLLGPLLPELGTRVGEASEGSGWLPHQDDPVLQPGPMALAGELLHDGLLRILSDAARRAPRLLILEDLHWADGATLRVLNLLSRRSEQTPILVLATSRFLALPEQRDNTQTRGTLPDVQDHEVLSLGPLSDAAVGSYFDTVLPEGHPGDRERLQRQCRGQPLLMQAATRQLAAQPGSELPDHAQGLARQLLARLDPDSRRIALTASVLGPSMRLRTLERFARDTTSGISLLARHGLRGGLDRRVPQLVAEQAGALSISLETDAMAPLLRLDADGQCRFTHALWWETLYDELEASERARLHLRAAEALLDERREGVEVDAATLAHHLERAPSRDVLERVIEWRRRAANEALAVFDGRVAARHLERAQALRGPELHTPEDAELALASAQAHLLSRDRSSGQLPRSARTAADNDLRRVAQYAQRRGDAELLARAAIGLSPAAGLAWLLDPVAARAEIRPQPVDPAQRAQLEEAARRLGPEQTSLQALVRVHLAPLVKADEARTLFQQARDLLRGSFEVATRFEALTRALGDAGLRDAPAERLSLADELIDGAERFGHPYRAFQGRVERHDALLRLGRLPQAEAELERLERLSLNLLHPACGLLVRALRISHALARGRHAAVADDNTEVFVEGQRVGLAAPGLRPASALFLLLLDRGGLGMLEQSQDSYPREPVDGDRIIGLHMALSRVLRKQPEAARQILLRFDLDELAYMRGEQRLLVWALLGWIGAGLCDRALCETAHEILSPFATRNVVSSLGFSYGPVAFYLGLTAAACERDEGALDTLEQASELCQQWGMPTWLARSEFEIFQVAARQGRTTRANEALIRAQTLAREHELQPLWGLCRQVGVAPTGG
ncbi:MAG: AAA family ATPase [Myxococcales bacterium]|nr:AAA family ATPase [Myxococcales bacterium]